jgi:phosphoribosylformylglycinamidine cyclo-ligase
LRSSGLHTNGYSLARKIVTEVAGRKYSDQFGEYGKTYGEVLLAPHRSFLPIRPLIIRKMIRGCAHITGGGFPGNVNRILPSGCDAVINAASWRPDPIFRFLQDTGHVENLEMYTTFNMGVGMVLVVEPSKTEAVMNAPETTPFSPVVIGRIAKGGGTVKIEF